MRLNKITIISEASYKKTFDSPVHVSSITMIDKKYCAASDINTYSITEIKNKH